MYDPYRRRRPRASDPTSTEPLLTSPDLQLTESLLDRLRRATIGRYDVYAELGSGGMASVFLALDLALDRKVAIKVMSPALMASPGAIERFRREARVAAGLSHPHIVPIHAIGEEPGLAYYVMKYIEGSSLDAVLRREGAQSLAFAQAIIGYMGHALHYAHQRGVVHRDVKPANVMLDREGWVYVTDFGIAKQVDGAGLTHSGVIIGTPHYMSPEQFNGHPVAGAADQYALGVVAYELLTGSTPYAGPSIGEVMKGHLFEPVPPMQTPGAIPAAVEDCVRRMLAKDPTQRFASVAEAVAAFGAVSATTEFETKSQIVRFAEAGAREKPQVSVPTSPVPSFHPTVHSAALAADTRPMTSPNLTPREPMPAASTPARSRAVIAVALLGVAAASVTALALWPRSGVERSGVPAAAVADSAAVPRAPVVSSFVDSTRASGAGSTPVQTEATPSPATPPRPAPTPVAAAAADSGAEPAASGGPRSQGKAPGIRDRRPLNGAAANKLLDRLDQRNEQRRAQGREPIEVPVALVRIGSRIPLAGLYVNDQFAATIGGKGARFIPVRSGEVRLSLRADGCASWDTTVTLAPRDTLVIGNRAPRCN